jgi:integrase/recombinase XerC
MEQNGWVRGLTAAGHQSRTLTIHASSGVSTSGPTSGGEAPRGARPRGTRELQAFLRFCAFERRLAAPTCAAYQRDVQACLDFLARERIPLEQARVGDLRAFLAFEQVRRPAVSSQSRATAALKLFFRFLVEEERLLRDPALPLRTPTKREVLPDVLTMGELKRLLAQTERAELWQRHFGGKPERDRLLLALMAYAGLRRSELLGLDWDDVDLSRRLLRIRKAKGGRQRMVPIHPALAPLFVDYLATRQPLREQALFVGVQGKRLKNTQLSQIFRHYVDAAGIGERKRVTPHTLRHVFASELLRAGANLRQIQELLGHKHLDSTQHYTRVTAHELRGAVKRLRWVGSTGRPTLVLPPAAKG